MFVLDTTRTAAELYLTAPLSSAMTIGEHADEVLLPVHLHYPSPHLRDARGVLSVEVDGPFHRFLESVPDAFLRREPMVETNGAVLVVENEVIFHDADPHSATILNKFVTIDRLLDLDPVSTLSEALRLEQSQLVG